MTRLSSCLLTLVPLLVLACTQSDDSVYRSSLTGEVCTPDSTFGGLHADADPVDSEPPQVCVAGQADPRACDPTDTKKTTVCHIPPGNPANEHTICVGNAAVVAHLAHGDFVGSCCAAPPPPPPVGCDDQGCCEPSGGGDGSGGDTTGSRSDGSGSGIIIP